MFVALVVKAIVRERVGSEDGMTPSCNPCLPVEAAVF
jgi:hypothetical protein